MGHQAHNAPEKKRKRLQKAAAEETAPEVEAKAAASADDPTPPLTNRGCLTPTSAVVPTATGILFHLDYLKKSIFAGTEEVVQLVNESLLEKAGMEPLWIDRGPAQRWGRILVGPGPVVILEPKAAKQVYTVVEIKGMGCALLGPEPLQAFMRYVLDSGHRWNGLRVDGAFDHVAFTPNMVDEASRRGDLNSRCLGKEDRDWNDNITGRTAYLGLRNDKNKLRRLRVYDMRGYTRCEAEYLREWANKAIRLFATTPLPRWPEVGLGLLRGMVDFVDSSLNERPERCPLLPWWEEFVGNVDRIRNLNEEDRRRHEEEDMRTAIGKTESTIMRCARGLWPIIKAFGADYVIERVEHHAGSRIDESDEARVEELKRWRYCGMAGLPGERPEDGKDLPI